MGKNRSYKLWSLGGWRQAQLSRISVLSKPRGNISCWMLRKCWKYELIKFLAAGINLAYNIRMKKTTSHHHNSCSERREVKKNIGLLKYSGCLNLPFLWNIWTHDVFLSKSGWSGHAKKKKQNTTLYLDSALIFILKLTEEKDGSHMTEEPL